MQTFSLTKKSIADLMDIGRYTLSHWGREQRNLYLEMLDMSFQQLAANPRTGKDCSDIRSGYRKFSAGSHVIFYRQTSKDSIEIVRILHGRMDCETWL
ncbi:MAG: plasmid stabilization protein ParE [Deltaproteobacteria bacterium HGW-Deltaproteobacteria-4]|nr:MAG: plasmid stabilization protein ParE [Deltaproteobacteria bacterium HGW-Deltaproteobacteria-4]